MVKCRDVLTEAFVGANKGSRQLGTASKKSREETRHERNLGQLLAEEIESLFLGGSVHFQEVDLIEPQHLFSNAPTIGVVFQGKQFFVEIHEA